MRSFRHASLCRGLLISWLPACVLAPAPPAVAQIEDPEPAEGGQAVQPGGEPGPAALLTDFLHYARLGKFQQARSFAAALLEHPDLDPVALLEVADRDPKTVETLITVVNNSSIGEEAQRVLDLLRQGEFLKRQAPARINANIEKLAGTPQVEYHAIQSLIDSGEYAVPWMVQALTDRAREYLKPRIIRALPQIGLEAVNPLAVALNAQDRDLQQNILRMLGELGYSHALPYLMKVLAMPDLPEDTRAVAEQALSRIARLSGRPVPMAAAEEFVWLAEQYYGAGGALRADPRLPTANVWYWRDDFITAVVVPREVYGPVMAMRCAEEALRLEPDREQAISLWLAANIRREARLGLDVESGEPVGNPGDPTRPAEFPRALYFSRAAGARYCLDVLARANRDQDTPVALGAIAALRTVAGEASLLGLGGEGGAADALVTALLFPDAVVRIKAALALAEARPKSHFLGDERVVPVLAEALGQTGTERFMVVDPDQENLNRIMELLRQSGAEVLGDTEFYRALERARRDLRTITGLYVSSGIVNPGIQRAVADLRGEFLFKMTPIVLLRGSGDHEIARDLAEGDARLLHVPAETEGPRLIETMQSLMAQTGRMLPDEDSALSLALQAADALWGLTVDGRTVLNVAVAEPVLIAVLADAKDELLRIKAAAVLANLLTETAQQALAVIALDPAQPETLRIACFGSLAESAKLNGNLLTEPLVARLVEVSADEPNLTLRTAASQALGALNLRDNQASEIIRKYYQG